MAMMRCQNGCATGPSLVVERRLQPGGLIASPNLPNSPGSQRHGRSDLGDGLAFVQVAQSQGSKDRTNRLEAATEGVIQFLAIRLFQANPKTTISPHAQVWAKTISKETVLNNFFRRSEN